MDLVHGSFGNDLRLDAGKLYMQCKSSVCRLPRNSMPSTSVTSCILTLPTLTVSTLAHQQASAAVFSSSCLCMASEHAAELSMLPKAVAAAASWLSIQCNESCIIGHSRHANEVAVACTPMADAPFDRNCCRLFTWLFVGQLHIRYVVYTHVRSTVDTQCPQSRVVTRTAALSLELFSFTAKQS